MKKFDTLREEMVERQLIRRGIDDDLILTAFRKVPRHRFVPEDLWAYAYEDRPLPIGCDQTISQPYMAALMAQCLMPAEKCRVLEIGTGSGFQTAILAELSEAVYSVERVRPLSEEASSRLRQMEYCNVVLKCGDGSRGWEEFAPYDRICVSCAAKEIPFSLLAQLQEGGRLVMPVGGEISQMLTVCQKQKKGVIQKKICECAFVPLLSSEENENT